MVHTLRVLGVLLLLAALTACGSGIKIEENNGESTVTITGRDGEVVQVSSGNRDEVTITNSDGEKVTFTGQDGQLPDGFPLPLISGGSVGVASKISTNGTAGYSVELFYTGTHKETGDFYERAIKDHGITVERTEVTSNDETMIILIGNSNLYDVWLMVTGHKEKGGSISIMWSEK